MAYIKDIRRENMRALAESIGGITAMAKQLGKSQSQISHLIGPHPIKNIGDKIAAEIEGIFGKTRGWMDKQHGLLSEVTATYTLDSSLEQRYLVPLIDWQQIWHWSKVADEQKIQQCEKWIPSITAFSKHSFALCVAHPIIDKMSGLCFPAGSIALLEPEKSANHGSIVAVSNSGSDITLAQFILDKDNPYLKSLHSTEIQQIKPFDTYKIHGVVKQILVQFD